MMKSCWHMVPAVLLLAGIAGCSGRARVIPEQEMTQLYAEMFLADQWLRDNSDVREIADTTLFFDPVFDRMGYTFEDYDKSLQYYAGKPEDFADIVAAAVALLKDRSDELYARIETIKKNTTDYKERDFSTDSARWSAPGLYWPAVEPSSSLPVLPQQVAEDSTGILDFKGIEKAGAIKRADELKLRVKRHFDQ